MKARLIIILVAALVLGVILGVGALRAREGVDTQTTVAIKPAAVRCAPLVEREFQLTESFYGLIEANVRVDMAFAITGRLATLAPQDAPQLRENDAVLGGQVIATLELDRFRAAASQAAAQEAQAQAAIAEAEAQAATARAELDDSQKNYTSVKQLFDTGTAKQRELDVAELKVKVSQAAVNRAAAAMATASASYDASRAAHDLAKVNLKDATLTAPFKGLVAAVPAEVGQIMNVGQPVMTLVDLSKVRLVIGAVERKLPLLHVGQRVKVEVIAMRATERISNDPAPVVYDGVIAIVPPAADPQWGVFNVEIELDNAAGDLKPGMVGKATVTLGKRTGVAIPIESVVRRGDRMYAFFVNDIDPAAPTATLVEINPVATEKDEYLLKDKPTKLARLVVEGQNRLSDGQAVEVIAPKTK